MMEVFTKEAQHWLHGKQEEEIFNLLLGNGFEKSNYINDVIANNHHLGALVDVLLEKNLERLKTFQISMILNKFLFSEVAKDPHLSCYRSMMSLILREWDYESFSFTVELIGSAENWRLFDGQILQLKDAVIKHANGGSAQFAVSLGKFLELIGDKFGFASIVTLIQDVDQDCVCYQCPTTTVTLSSIWMLTREFWIGKWRGGLGLLQQVATRAFNKFIFDCLWSEGLYDFALDNPSSAWYTPLHYVRNARVCEKLLESKNRNVEELLNMKTALSFEAEWPLGGPIAKVLLLHSADPASILSANMINPIVLMEVLKFASTELTEELLTEKQLSKVIHLRFLSARRMCVKIVDILAYNKVKLSSSFIKKTLLEGLKMEIEEGEMEDCFICLVCGLYCAKLADDEGLRLIESEFLSKLSKDHQRDFLSWSTRTHKFCTKARRDRALLSLLCFSKIELHIPKEIQLMILEHL